jgi:hypothetical protein
MDPSTDRQVSGAHPPPGTSRNATIGASPPLYEGRRLRGKTQSSILHLGSYHVEWRSGKIAFSPPFSGRPGGAGRPCPATAPGQSRAAPARSPAPPFPRGPPRRGGENPPSPRTPAGLPPWRPPRVPSGFGAPQRLPDARGAADWCSGLVLAPPPGGTVAVTLTTGPRRPIAISTVELQEFL